MVAQKGKLITASIILFIVSIGVLADSSVVCRICVLFLFVICIYLGIHEKYILNPYFMFALVPFTLLIYAKISYYHLELTVNTWLFAIINIAAFVISMEFTPNYKKYNKCRGVGEGRQLLDHAVLLLVLGYLPTVYSLILGGSMPLASVFTLFSSGAIVCVLKSKRKKYIGLVFVVFVLSWIGYVTKSSILTFAIAVLIGYEKYYVESVKQKRILIVLSVLGLILMISAFSFANQGRGSESGMSAVQYYSKYGGLVWNEQATLLMPYMYLTTPWANLQYVMETQPAHTYGLWFIKPLIGYFQIDTLFLKYYEMNAYSNFNTFTYLAYCFKDFGFWGSCLSSAFLGFFTKKVYTRYAVSRSPLDVACYVLVAQAVIEMFFSNHFFTQSYPFTIVIIMGIYKYIFCKKSSVELEPELEGTDIDDN